MSKIEIGSLVGVLITILVAAIGFGQFTERLAALERDHAGAKESMQEAGAEILKKAKSYIVDRHETDCSWMEYMGRYPEVNIQQCPAGFYAKGLGFYHKHGENGAYQMSYRLHCCALTPFSSEQETP